jgi:transposase
MESIGKARKRMAAISSAKLRFFAGLSVQQAIAILGISRATADRWWSYARAFLYCEMRGDTGVR